MHHETARDRAAGTRSLYRVTEMPRPGGTRGAGVLAGRRCGALKEFFVLESFLKILSGAIRINTYTVHVIPVHAGNG